MYRWVADVELCEAFSLFDKDGDGQITVDEVAQTMTSLGLDVRLSDIEIMVDQVDTDGQFAHTLPVFSRSYCMISCWHDTVVCLPVRPVCDAVHCSKTIHPTAKVPERVNRKCPLETRFYNFQPLHLSYPLKLSIS